jgi:hypothetical protein
MGTKLSPPEKTGSRPTPPQLIGWRRLPPFEKISISSALRCEENPIFSAVSRPRDITFQFLKRVISPPSLFSEYKCVDHEWPWDFTEIAHVSSTCSHERVWTSTFDCAVHKFLTHQKLSGVSCPHNHRRRTPPPRLSTAAAAVLLFSRLLFS